MTVAGSLQPLAVLLGPIAPGVGAFFRKEIQYTLGEF
jgi:hypothetical protein